MIDVAIPALADYQRARRLRAEALRLRHIADEITIEASALEGRAFPDALKGHEIADIAVAILRERGPTHYRQLVELVESRSGRVIRGQDPAATLNANVWRHPEIRSAGRGICAVEDREGIHAA